MALRNWIVAAGTAPLLLALGAATAGAQSWPEKPVRIVVPTSPSTPPDLITRIVAAELQKAEGWTVIVENKTGAMQTVAGRDVLRSPADGYSVWSMGMVSTVAPTLLADVPFDVEKDFTHVIQATRSYNALVVNPGVKAGSVKEFVDLLKANPGKLNFSSGGFGTPAHLIGELFKLKYGVNAVHVPYLQFPQAIGDLVSGVNQYMFITTLPVIDLVASGKLKALAVTSPEPLAAMKGVPTMASQGFADLAVADWHGFSVRKGTPQEAVDKLSAAIGRALASQSVRTAFNRIGAEPVGGTSQDFSALVAKNVAYWKEVVKEAGIKLPN